MRIVIAIMFALAFVVIQGDRASADPCHYVFKSGEGMVDSCTGEHASNSTPRGAGPAINQCHPSYAGCLKPDASDYDCEGGGVGNGPLYVKGPLRLLGDDVFGLDANHNGIACEADE